MKSLSICTRWVMIFAVLCSAEVAVGAQEDEFPFDVDQLLRGPDREDISWKVMFIARPQMMPEQRSRLNVSMMIRESPPNGSIRRDLHYVLKAAPANKRWVPGGIYVHVPPERYNPGQICYLYLSPGRYTIAVIVYDAIHKQTNVLRKKVNVPRPKKNSPRMQYDRDLPPIEFASRSIGNVDRPLGFQHTWMPVNNTRPLCIDIVANFSDLSPSIPSFNDPYSDRLEMARVLSHLRLRKGSIRVSILDVLQMKTLVDRKDASNFDWQGASDVLAKRERDTIDAGLLSSQTPSGFLADKLYEILKDGSCAAGGEASIKAIILISRVQQFPRNTHIEQVSSQDPAATRVFYFHTGWDLDDDLAIVLKKTKARRFPIWNVQAFHKALASMISSLEELK